MNRRLPSWPATFALGAIPGCATAVLLQTCFLNIDKSSDAVQFVIALGLPAILFGALGYLYPFAHVLLIGCWLSAVVMIAGSLLLEEITGSRLVGGGWGLSILPWTVVFGVIPLTAVNALGGVIGASVRLLVERSKVPQGVDGPP